jgi:hypothetical protein
LAHSIQVKAAATFSSIQHLRCGVLAMTKGRHWTVLVIAVALSTLATAGRLPAQKESVERVALAPGKVRRPISLRDRLVVGLQARLKSEVAFVELVVARVQMGDLPQRVVDETFFWARARGATLRNGRTRRPIIYFKPAMEARAKRLGVEL